jgi:hypothetical protein
MHTPLARIEGYYGLVSHLPTRGRARAGARPVDVLADKGRGSGVAWQARPHRVVRGDIYRRNNEIAAAAKAAGPDRKKRHTTLAGGERPHMVFCVSIR